MRSFLLSLLVFSVVPAWAQDWAKARLESSPRHGEWVTVKSGGRDVRAFVVYPEVKQKAPVVLVIHEIFGLTDWARSACDQFAALGCIAIAPDLLSGETFTGIDGAREAIGRLPADQITADVKAVATYARGLAASDRRLVVAGFCWGGGEAFRFATNEPDLSAALVFYGSGPDSPDEIARITAPVYGFYGENDARINAALPETEKLMKAAGKAFEPVIYAGAGHGFMRAGEAPDASEPNRKARAEAWQRVKTILENLPKASR